MEIDSRIASYQIGETPIRLEMVILELVPDLVLVYRDTNPTLASTQSLKIKEQIIFSVFQDNRCECQDIHSHTRECDSLIYISTTR